MISYAVYKLVHYLGIFTLLTALAATLGRAARGAPATVGAEAGDPWKKRLVMLHGVALFLVLLGGFGMLARLSVDHGTLLPGWIWVKLGVWLVLGGLVAFRRSSRWAARALVLVPLLALLAGWAAYAKPL